MGTINENKEISKDMDIQSIYDLTDEEIEQMMKLRLEDAKSQSLEKQLGFYVGEQILDKFLPTLDTDDIQSRIVINVSEEEKVEHERLTSLWYNRSSTSEDDVEWLSLLEYRKMLEKKYLPKLLRCYFDTLNVDNIEEFKLGIIDSLWSCDMCSYSLNPEDINIYDDNWGYSTYIEFKLGVE